MGIKYNKSRRSFIKNGVIGVAGATFFSPFGKENPHTQSQKKEKEWKFITRKLGKTGIDLPVVSMGVMNADNPKLVEAALDAGIRHLDTAHGYQRGRNEEMIGKVIKGRPRDSFIIGTKIFEPRDRKTGLFPKEVKMESFITKFETSLKRLGLETIDILHLHNIARKESAQFEPYLSALQKLKKEGKVRFTGLSTHVNEPEVIRAAVDCKGYDIVLTAYNFRQPHRDEVKKAIAYAVKKGLGVIAMKTQAGVYWDPERQHPINMKAALKWVLQDKNVHTTIPGFITFDQMETDLSVMEDLSLTPQERLDLQKGNAISMAGLYCSQCQQCVFQCRYGLDVPAFMRTYMYAYGYRNLGLAKETLESIPMKRLPCGQCHTCSVTCKMGFNVRDRLQDIFRLKHVPEDFLV